MHANNEVGTIQPIADIAKIAHERGIPVHTDAAQSTGKISTDVRELGVDLLSLAGHKLYAPKGIGALFVRHGLEIEPLVHGGSHERGRRAGTESAMLAAALGKACEIARPWIGMSRTRRLRDLFWEGLRSVLGKSVVWNGDSDHVLPNTLNVSFLGYCGSNILAQLSDVAASTGSACRSRRVGVSPVLKAMGVAREVGLGAIRFSLGRGTTQEEVERVVSRLAQVLA